MDDFYFAVGSDPYDVFIVVNGNWIPYKRCDTEEAAQALVTGQNESRRDDNAKDRACHRDGSRRNGALVSVRHCCRGVHGYPKRKNYAAVRHGPQQSWIPCALREQKQNGTTNGGKREACLMCPVCVGLNKAILKERRRKLSSG